MSGWRDSLGRIGGNAAPGLAGFGSWWRRSLLAWLPLRWRLALGLERSRLLLAVRGEKLQLLRERGGQLQHAAELPWPLSVEGFESLLAPPLRALPRHWLLAPGQALCRRLRLPAAARARLHDVARFEIDRQTPFSAEQVYFDVRDCGSTDPAWVDAELVVLPRARLDGSHGIDPAWQPMLAGVDVQAGDGQPLQVNLLPPPRRYRRPDPAARRDRLLLLAGVVLFVCAGWLFLDNRQNALDALQAEVQARAERARQVSAQRQQLADLVDGAAFLQQQAGRHPPLSAVWEELSQRLPDGTWLDKMSVEGRHLQLIGQSSEASGLVQQLEGSSLWRTPALSGVLRGEGGYDHFTLGAELTGQDPQQEAEHAAGD